MREIEYLLPANWTAITLDQPLGAQVDAVSRRMFEGTPNEAESARRSLAAKLRTMLEQAKHNGALQFLMEVDPIEGVRSGASLTMMPFPDNGDDPMETLVAIASQTPGAVVLEAGDLVVLRTMAVEDATADAQEAVQETAVEVPELAKQDLGELNVCRRTLTYYVGHPGLREDWMVFIGQIMADASEDASKLADIVVKTCDRVVESVRFV